mgnify:CR=1 FL=1|tara:strand:- start:1135 stop:2157 length:1023 start_codon:yes stop_codon:yes gene_type:complete
MIIKEFQLSVSINKEALPNFVLFYGPNEGLIRDNILKISETFKQEKVVDEITINGKVIDENKHIIDEETRSFSMFSEQKLIYIENIKEKHLEFFENIEFEDNKVLVIIKSENLNKNSKIRNFFEKHKKYAAIPCYDDDVRSIMKLISQFQLDNEIKFDSDIKNYLIQNLSTDRLISKNELEKILLIIDHKQNKEIKLENVQEILNDSSSNSLNIINEHVMYGKVNQVSKNLYKIFDEGTNAVAIIRSLLNYLVRVHKTQIEIKKTVNFDEAIKHLRPPIFWKDKDNFRNHCSKWPSRDILHYINRLLEAEFMCKSQSSLNNAICEKYILSIAKKGEIYFN